MGACILSELFGYDTSTSIIALFDGGTGNILCRKVISSVISPEIEIDPVIFCCAKITNKMKILANMIQRILLFILILLTNLSVRVLNIRLTVVVCTRHKYLKPYQTVMLGLLSFVQVTSSKKVFLKHSYGWKTINVFTKYFNRKLYFQSTK